MDKGHPQPNFPGGGTELLSLPLDSLKFKRYMHLSDIKKKQKTNKYILGMGTFLRYTYLKQYLLMQ